VRSAPARWSSVSPASPRRSSQSANGLAVTVAKVGDADAAPRLIGRWYARERERRWVLARFEVGTTIPPHPKNKCLTRPAFDQHRRYVSNFSTRSRSCLRICSCRRSSSATLRWVREKSSKATCSSTEGNSAVALCAIQPTTGPARKQRRPGRFIAHPPCCDFERTRRDQAAYDHLADHVCGLVCFRAQADAISNRHPRHAGERCRCSDRQPGAGGAARVPSTETPESRPAAAPSLSSRRAQVAAINENRDPNHGRNIKT